ncbi:hypothetical protein EYC84_004593 [Monilinia fructicola]|uniref:Uncharacterized protein n=1 Tax=Monilinia fructicola TaxID=38448 RepID=A0A5M9K4R7_MONFR|nr:hypothetical protein EYC84_004593 [Monilinia fructicola]
MHFLDLVRASDLSASATAIVSNDLCIRGSLIEKSCFHNLSRYLLVYSPRYSIPIMPTCLYLHCVASLHRIQPQVRTVLVLSINLK